MSERIEIRGLRAVCRIGTRDEERQEPREVLLTLRLTADLSRACATDDLRDTVDYGELTRNVTRFVEASAFFLIERLADRVAAVCLEDPRVDRAEVTVEKPGAIPNARSAGVTVVRTKEPELQNGAT